MADGRHSGTRHLPSVLRHYRPVVGLALLSALVAALLTAGMGPVSASSTTTPIPHAVAALTGQTFSPPPTIAADCSRDVSDPLRTWLNSLPAGTANGPIVVNFAPNGCYLVNESLFLRDFTDVVFDGNGAEFLQTTPTTESFELTAGVEPYAGSSYMPFLVSFSEPLPPIIWYFDGGSDITIENMTINGPNVSQDSNSGGGTMVDSGIELDGVQRVDIRDNIIEHVDGDFVTLEGLFDAPTANWNYPTTDVTISDNIFDMSGRQGITPEYVNRLNVTDNTFSDVDATAIDMEGDVVGGCSCNVSVNHNVFSTMIPYIVSAVTGTSVTNFAFTDNTLTDGAQLRIQLAPALASSDVTIADNTGGDAPTWPWQSVFIGHGTYGDSDGWLTGVDISGNTVPNDLYGESFAYSGQQVSGLAVRNNVLASSRPLVPLQMDGNLTQGYSCGNSASVSGPVVDGGCSAYTPPPLPTAPTVPADLQVTAGQAPSSFTTKQPALGIASSTLGPLAVSVPFSATLQTTDGAGAVSWSLAGGSLPAGLQLSSLGTVAGTPTTPGPVGFTIRATDGEGRSSTQDYSVVVSPLDATAASPVSSIAATPDGGGYWLTDWTGQVLTRGDASYYGSMAGTHLNAPITHIVATGDGRGYWLVASDGGIFSFGDAPFFGSMGGQHLNAPVVDVAPTADDRGYWLVATDGGVFSFGDARFLGSMGGHHLNAPIVGVDADPTSGGYWLVASDGGLFAFGAPFLGSAGNIRLHQPINGMTAPVHGGGYWFVSSDGGVFAFGSSAFRGSMGGQTLRAPVVGMAADNATGGYWLVAADGGVFSFGAPFFGSGTT